MWEFDAECFLLKGHYMVIIYVTCLGPLVLHEVTVFSIDLMHFCQQCPKTLNAVMQTPNAFTLLLMISGSLHTVPFTFHKIISMVCRTLDTSAEFTRVLFPVKRISIKLHVKGQNRLVS